jgi:hypothetical protein
VRTDAVLRLLSDGDAHWLTPFDLGDALALGGDTFSARAAAVFPDQQWAWQTMATWAWVARAIPSERRHPLLSFSHHAEVATLPPEAQDALLGQAEEQGWTTAELRQQVRDWRRSNGATARAKAFLASGKTQRVRGCNDDRG